MDFRQLPHTADLCLEFWSATEPLCLLAGAHALVHVLTESTKTIATDASVPFEVLAADRESRMVQWLNHVLLLALMKNFLVAGADMELVSFGARGVAHGSFSADQMLRTEVKSVTYYDAYLQCESDRWVGRVVIDV